MREQPALPRANRFQAGLPASVELDGREIKCRARNLSRSGVLLVGEIACPEEAELWMTISSPAGDLRMTVAGRVVRHDRDPETGEPLLGVEFLKIHEADRTALEALISRVIEGVAPAPLEQLPDKATHQQILVALEKVPLAHRVQLALHGLPKDRERLLHDPHPQVMDALARNPSLMLQEVMALLRMPHLFPSTLEIIGKSSRWTEPVKVLVATHRNTPLAVANALVSRMSAATLERVIRAPGLNAALQAKVLARLPRR